VIEQLQNPSNVTMKLKYADSWESLYHNPRGVDEMPLA